MLKAQADWAELIEEVRAHKAAGFDPGDPRVQDCARRWQALIEQFTGGDPGVRQSLQRMYETEGAEQASRGMLDPEVMAYAARAQELLTRGSRPGS